MNINLQFHKRAVCLVVCFVLVFSFSIPVFASSIDSHQPYDYIDNIVYYDGVDYVTFKFSDIPHLVDVWENPSGTKTQKIVTSNFTYRPKVEGTNTVRFRDFPMGVEQWDSNALKPDASIDIGDIMPGSPLELSLAFQIDTYRIYTPDAGDPNIGIPILRGYVNCGFYTFDSDGKYMETVWGKGSESYYEFGVNGGTTYSPSYSYTFDADVKYLVPFLDLQFSDSYNIHDLLIQITPMPVVLSCFVDTIYKDSVTMDRIERHLEDISSGISDANDKLDGIQGSLDDVNQGIGDINDAINKDSGIDSGVADFGSAGDSLSDGMSGAVDSIDEGLGVVSGLTSSGVMTGTLTTISTALAHAFSGRHQIYLCGLRFNPFNGWVLVFGGLALIGLVISYIFRKRGGK